MWRTLGHICGAGKVHIVYADSGSAYNLQPASRSLEHLLSHLRNIRAWSDPRPCAHSLSMPFAWLSAPCCMPLPAADGPDQACASSLVALRAGDKSRPAEGGALQGDAAPWLAAQGVITEQTGTRATRLSRVLKARVCMQYLCGRADDERVRCGNPLF